MCNTVTVLLYLSQCGHLGDAERHEAVVVDGGEAGLEEERLLVEEPLEPHVGVPHRHHEGLQGDTLARQQLQHETLHLALATGHCSGPTLG